jgi:hypothetical protein
MDGSSWPARWPPPAAPAAPVPPLPSQVRASRAHLGGDFGAFDRRGRGMRGGFGEVFRLAPRNHPPIPRFGGWFRCVRDFGVGMQCCTARGCFACCFTV